MAESHVEAPQASRVAQHVRAGRASRREATDITAAFDQILASAAQPTQQPTPQIASPAPSVTIDAKPAVSLKHDTSRSDETSPINEHPVGDRPAPDFASLPVRPEPAAHANHPVATPANQASERHAASSNALASHPPVRLADTAPKRLSERKPAATREGIAAEAMASNTPGERHTGAKEFKLVASSVNAAKQAPLAVEKAPIASQSMAEKARPAIQANGRVTEAKPVTIDTSRRVLAAQDAASASRERATNVAERRTAAVKPTFVRADAKPTDALQPPAPKPDVSVTAATTLTAPSPLRRVKEKGEVKGKAVEPTNTAPRAVTHEPEHAAAVARSTVTRQPASSRVEPVNPVAKANETDPTAPVTASPVVSATAASAKPREAVAMESRRTRDTRSAPGVTVDAQMIEPAVANTSQAPLTSPPTNGLPAAITASAVPAAPVVVKAAVMLAPATENKPAAPATANATATESHDPTGAMTPARENGKTLLDSAKTAATRTRPRTDPQQEVDRVRLVERVAKALQTAHDRGAPLKLRLTPPELGVLRIELSVRNGALSAKLEAETPAAKAAILENLPALRERLTAQEIKIERFDVDLMQQPDGSPGERQSFADAESSRERAMARSVRNERQPATSNTSEEIKPTPIRSSTGRLNVLA